MADLFLELLSELKMFHYNDTLWLVAQLKHAGGPGLEETCHETESIEEAAAVGSGAFSSGMAMSWDLLGDATRAHEMLHWLRVKMLFRRFYWDLRALPICLLASQGKMSIALWHFRREYFPELCEFLSLFPLREHLLKKECFLSGIARITYPPPLTPFWATCTSFFGRQNRRFARMTEKYKLS